MKPQLYKYTVYTRESYYMLGFYRVYYFNHRDQADKFVKENNGKSVVVESVA